MIRVQSNIPNAHVFSEAIYAISETLHHLIDCDFGSLVLAYVRLVVAHIHVLVFSSILRYLPPQKYPLLGNVFEPVREKTNNLGSDQV